MLSSRGRPPGARAGSCSSQAFSGSCAQAARQHFYRLYPTQLHDSHGVCVGGQRSEFPFSDSNALHARV